MEQSERDLIETLGIRKRVQHALYLSLGILGTLLTQSKRGYVEEHPNDLIVFNSNIFIDKTKVWFGDINVTKNLETLQKIATTNNVTLHILREMDGRFEYEDNPRLEKAVAVIYPDGNVTFKDSFK